LDAREVRYTWTPLLRIVAKEITRDTGLRVKPFGAHILVRTDQVHYDRLIAFSGNGSFVRR
jgi:hypothetical protein